VLRETKVGGNNIKHNRLQAKTTAIKLMNGLRGVKKYKICGSIRRKKGLVGDIDAVAIIDDQLAFVNSVQDFADRILAIGNRNVRFVYNDIQVDIMMVNTAHFGAAVLHFTGSKFFNIRCRTKAKSMGLMLNEYGLWDMDGKMVESTEEGIISKLEMGEKYFDPTNR
jgi:DNA polymerase (family 10)